MTNANAFDAALIRHFWKTDFNFTDVRPSSRDGRPRRGKRPDEFIRVSSELALDPAAVMRVMLTKGELASMSDPDYDYFDLRKQVKGELKGGKQGDRDKDFGKSEDFWIWWHLHEKAKNGGRDITTKADADKYYQEYLQYLQMVRGSAFMQAVRRLSFAQQKIARPFLYAFAIKYAALVEDSR